VREAPTQTQLDELQRKLDDAGLAHWIALPASGHGEFAYRAERQSSALRQVVHADPDVLVKLALEDEARINPNPTQVDQGLLSI